jgi:hypothetical protein
VFVFIHSHLCRGAARVDHKYFFHEYVLSLLFVNRFQASSC